MSLEEILRAKLPPEETETGDVLWRLVLYSIRTLEELKSALETQEGAMISVKQEKEVGMICELIMALGILPSMINGVGTSLKERSKFAELLLDGKEGSVSVYERHCRLVFVINSFLDFVRNEILGRILFTKHLGDILSGLIQLGYAPLRKVGRVPLKPFLIYPV